MLNKADYWKNSSLDWERKRYDSFFSPFLYSSLHNRRDYLAWCISQLPRGTRILELGCGSGRIYDLVQNKSDYHYTGIDISHEAIESARNKFSKESAARWICASADEILNFEADFVISAGFLDWLTDSQILNLAAKNRFTYFLHSFSYEKKNWRTAVHNIFSKLVSLRKSADYSPRKFAEDKIKSLLGRNILIESHPDLSFGCFARTDYPAKNLSFENFKTFQYFSKKKRFPLNPVELFCRFSEARALKKVISENPNPRALDYGSGSGRYSEMLLAAGAAHVTAIDPFVKTTVASVYRNRFQYYADEYCFTDFQFNKYDFILAAGVFEFVDNPVNTLSKLATKLVSGGKLIIIVPKSSGMAPSFYRLYHSFSGRKVKTGLTPLFEKFLLSNKFSIAKKNCGPLNYLIEVTPGP